MTGKHPTPPPTDHHNCFSRDLESPLERKFAILEPDCLSGWHSSTQTHEAHKRRDAASSPRRPVLATIPSPSPEADRQVLQLQWQAETRITPTHGRMLPRVARQRHRCCEASGGAHPGRQFLEGDSPVRCRSSTQTSLSKRSFTLDNSTVWTSVKINGSPTFCLFLRERHFRRSISLLSQPNHERWC
jgi:hypothetical protein